MDIITSVEVPVDPSNLKLRKKEYTLRDVCLARAEGALHHWLFGCGLIPALIFQIMINVREIFLIMLIM